jgi:hypothetical protein
LYHTIVPCKRCEDEEDGIELSDARTDDSFILLFPLFDSLAEVGEIFSKHGTPIDIGSSGGVTY